MAIMHAELGDLSAAERFLATHGADTHPGTLVANVDVPRVRASVAMAQTKPLDAVAALEPARPYELAGYTVPNQRAEAWLEAARPEMAVDEYRKILDNPGVDPLSLLYPLAHLGMAHAYLRLNKTAESHAEYESFFAAWKDADSDVPVLKQARAEYAGLGKSSAHAAK
jgi:hypothetical protein